MKKILSLILLASTQLFTHAQAAEPQASFNASTGVLIIPTLNLGSDLYYVQLKRLSTTSYDFRLTTASVTKTTPGPNDNWASASDIVGEWKLQAAPLVTVSIKANGTYEMKGKLGDCPAGTESGTYGYYAATGVFFAQIQTDTNGDCGFSNNAGAIRLKRDGTALVMGVSGPEPEENRLIPQ